MIARPALRGDLERVMLSGELVVRDPVAGAVHHLNRSATLVVSLLDGQRTPQAVADLLEEVVVCASPSELTRDVQQLLAELDRASLLERPTRVP